MRALFIIGCLLSVITVVASCQDEQRIEYSRYYSAGVVVYQTHCQNCHGDRGQGLAALIPPLKDSIYLKSNKHQLACYIQNGLNGSITVDKREFNSKMPAVALSHIEIGQVLTYVGNSFGNKTELINTDNIEVDLKGCR